MTSSTLQFSAAKTWLALAMAMAAASLASPVLQAQQVYRIVGADGKVTFSDRPPPATSPAASASPKAADVSTAAASAPTGLPFELRQVAVKYPVVLYTSDNCAPCSAGRSMLTSRGIPFAERTVGTAEDASALQRLSGESSLPFLTIGAQQLKGYSDTEWTQFLDAAGYPKASALPSSYRPPAAAPLVALKEAPVAAPAGNGTPASTAGKTPAPVPTPVQVQPANPTGIKF